MSSIVGLFNRGRGLPDRASRHKDREAIEIPNRMLAARDASSSSIARLGPDLMVMILQVLHAAYPESMRNVKQVSSNFHHLAEYIACETIKLDLSLSESGATSEKLLRLEQRELLVAVRCIDVTAAEDEIADLKQRGKQDHNAEEDAAKVSAMLRRLLPKMKGLKDLHWPNANLSPATLAVLKGLPAVRLHVDASSYGNQWIVRLVDCSNLYSLIVRRSYRGAEDCLKITKPLKEVLLSCRNLRKLELDISQPRSGCVVYGLPFEYCGMGFINGEKPPALESLSISSYPFGCNEQETSGPGAFGRQRPFSEGYPGRGTEQEYWISNFDWSRLKVLEVKDASLALGLMSKLPKLEEVNLKHSRSAETISQFYLGVPNSLRAIEVPQLEAIGLAGILRHGSALRKLQIHQNEGYNKNWKAEAVDNASLTRIRDECPLIEELHLDVGRSGEWPFDTLDTLASFARLRTLTIWFELGMGKDEDIATPKVTFSSVEMIFRYLRQHSPREPPKLRELHVHSGSPPGLGHGYPSAMAFWPQYNSMHFRCLLSDRDDEASQGVFTIDCPGLDKQANEYLRGERETFQPAEGYNHMYDMERVEVARNGPKSRDEWKAHY